MSNKNSDRPIIQSSGYNGSEPTRICPHCGKEKPLSDFGFRKMADKNGPPLTAGAHFLRSGEDYFL